MTTGDSGIVQRIRRYLGRARRLRRRLNSLERVDFILDVQARLPHLKVRTVYDVGAHIGITAIAFSDAWPQATVYAFEPSLRNRERMKRNLVGKPEVRQIPIGFSDSDSVVEFLFDPAHPSMSRLGEGEGEKESIQLKTIDGFSRDENVDAIDVMKIDVEGHEPQVLKGAHRMLSEGAIGVLRIETAVDPDSDYHTQFFELTETLHPYGYRLFGIYEQSEDGIDPRPKLRRFDCAFISPRLIETRPA